MDSLLDQLAVASEVDEAGLLRVYADHLILDGDSLGELIVVATERLARDTPELRRREDALIAQHTARITSVHGRPVRELRWRRGVVDAIELDFIDKVDLDVFAKLAAEPAMRLVRRMRWDANAIGGAARLLGSAFAELARLAPRFPRLTDVVVIDSNAPESVVDLGDVSVLYAALPDLKVLELGGERAELGELALPALRRFVAPRLAPDDAKRLVAARLPVLEELTLGFRGPTANLAATFGPLLHRDFGPQLRALELALPTPDAQRWLVGELPHCPLARHAKRLGFTRAPLDDDSLAQLIADAPQWRPRLERLELRERGISATRAIELWWAFGRALVLI